MIPDDVILLVFTNWGRHWPNRTAYLGTDAASSSLMHFPGMSLDSTECERGCTVAQEELLTLSRVSISVQGPN